MASSKREQLQIQFIHYYIPFHYIIIYNNINDKNLIFLNESNNIILKLAKDVNENNYIKIIIFIQKNKFDTNNSLIDQIINEDDEEKKASLINQMNTYTAVDFNSSGYTASYLLCSEISYIFVSKNPNQQIVFYVGKNIRRLFR